MGRDHRISLLALLVLGACKSNATVDETPPPPPTKPKVVAVDHVAPDELVEGKDSAFELKLPYGFRLVSMTGISVASGEASRAKVVSYVRARVADGKLIQSPAVDRFIGVRVPSVRDRPLDIEVRDVTEQTTQISIYDRTPLPDLPSGTPAERFKEMGLKPNGKILDPSKLE